MEKWTAITSLATGSLKRWCFGETDPTFNPDSEEKHTLSGPIELLEGVPMNMHTVVEGAVVLMAETALLPLLKAAKKSEIDARTRELIVAGVTINGLLFSMSEIAQKNMAELREQKAFLNYPFKLSTKDNEQVHLIADANEMEAMYQAAFAHIVGHYTSGNTLKEAVALAQSQTQLDAIVDNR